MKRLLVLIVFFCTVSVLQGQSFILTTEGTKVVQNTAFQIKYTLEGARGSSFVPPDFAPFEVVGGPSQSTSMSTINGVTTQTQSYTYSLYAPKIGKHRVLSATILVSGKSIKSNRVEVEVVKGKTSAQISEDDRKSYVRLEATTEEAILGQQITLEYKLYTQQDINGYDLVNESDYDGFFAQELRNYRAQVTREVVDGEEFYTKVLKKIALFPQRTGRFDFAPVTVTLAIPVAGAKRSRGFFSSVPTRQKRIKTNPLSLIVNDPPEGAPISFSGAVGKYAMSARLNKTKITTDDAFVITMEVRGTGDGKTFSAPNQPVIKDLEYYDPNVVRDEDTSRDGVVSNYKQIEYLIVPKKPGRYYLRPEFSYYDTDSSRYMTIRSSPMPVTVSQGDRVVIADDRDVSVSQSLMGDREHTDHINSFWLRFSDWFLWTSFLLFLSAMTFMFVRKSQLDKLENLDPAEKKRRAALKLANQKLEKAREFQANGNQRLFYEEVSTTMNTYLGNKYGLPNSDFQKEKIKTTLANHDVAPNLIDNYLSILKTCEMALFAGQPSEKMSELLEQCTSLILELEN